MSGVGGRNSLSQALHRLRSKRQYVLRVAHSGPGFWCQQGMDLVSGEGSSPYSSRTAIALDPNSSDAHAYLAQFLCAVGRADDGVAEAESGQHLHPLGQRAKRRIRMLGSNVPRSLGSGVAGPHRSLVRLRSRRRSLRRTVRSTGDATADTSERSRIRFAGASTLAKSDALDKFLVPRVAPQRLVARIEVQVDQTCRSCLVCTLEGLECTV